jgi:radical SAM superfamily enzyme YgiQ (UPF0313 family)
MRSPITAPAILKAVVEQNGFSAYCMDINLKLWRSVDASKLGHIWYDTDLTFRYVDRFEKFWNDVILPRMPEWLSEIRSKNPRWVGITVFSQRSSLVTQKFCEYLRDNLPSVQIVIGGPYADVIGPKLHSNGSIDAYVIGEGEVPLVSILKGELKCAGINGRPPEQISDLDTIPIPDYSDFDMHLYPKTWNDPRVRDDHRMGTDFLYITGSRGCVRKCSFCDIGDIWPKYRYRSGHSIAKEMMHQSNKYGIRKFIFTDSLINGSVKQLESLCRTLIQYYKSGQMKPVLWQGQFIARPEKHMNEESYKLLREAGCFFVSIGVESGSEIVRTDMNKMFTDKDLEFTISMCEKYSIEMAWLLMVGYPTETEDEFQKTLDLLTRYSYLNSIKMIRSVALGPTMEIVRGAPIFKDQENHKIFWINNQWISGDNTKEVRIRRWLRLKDHCIKLGYPVVEKATEHLLEELKQYDNTVKIESAVYDLHNENSGSMDRDE